MTQLFRAQKNPCIELPDLESQNPGCQVIRIDAAGPGIVLFLSHLTRCIQYPGSLKARRNF